MFTIPSPGLEPPHPICTHVDLTRTPSGQITTCLCGEHLDHEDEVSYGMCWNCLADEAGLQMPEPEIKKLLTRAQIDELCGVHHRRMIS